jgi:hypothetical protein
VGAGMQNLWLTGFHKNHYNRFGFVGFLKTSRFKLNNLKICNKKLYKKTISFMMDFGEKKN